MGKYTVRVEGLLLQHLVKSLAVRTVSLKFELRLKNITVKKLKRGIGKQNSTQNGFSRYPIT